MSIEKPSATNNQLRSQSNKKSDFPRYKTPSQPQDADKFKFGKTKVLFRAGQVAYLEKLRADKQRDACLLIQKTARGFVASSRYRRVRRAVLGLQRHARGYLARKRARAIREQRAATRLQAWAKGWMQRSRYARLRRTAVGLQSRARGLLARRRFRHMQDVAAVTKIQRWVPGESGQGFMCRVSVFCPILEMYSNSYVLKIQEIDSTYEQMSRFSWIGRMLKSPTKNPGCCG